MENPFWNGREGRLRALWRIVAVFGIFVAASQLLTGALVTGWFTAGADPGPQQFFALSRVAALAATFVALAVGARYIDRRPFRQFGFGMGRGWWLDLVFGLALGALLMTGIFLVELAAGWVRVTDTLESPGGTGFATSMVFPLITFICVGVYEEALARGYLLRNAAEGLNLPSVGPQVAIVAAWALSSAVFGLAHLANPNASAISTFNIFMAGLFLGLGYILTGQLAIPIGLHITWNLFQGNVYGFPVSGLDAGAEVFAIDQSGARLLTGGPFGPEAGLIGVAAMLTGSLLILLWVRLRRGRLSLFTDERLKEASAEQP